MTKIMTGTQSAYGEKPTCRTCRYARVGETVTCNHPVTPRSARITAFHEKYEYLHFHCDDHW